MSSISTILYIVTEGIISYVSFEGYRYLFLVLFRYIIYHKLSYNLKSIIKYSLVHFQPLYLCLLDFILTQWIAVSNFVLDIFQNTQTIPRVHIPRHERVQQDEEDFDCTLIENAIILPRDLTNHKIRNALVKIKNLSNSRELLMTEEDSTSEYAYRSNLLGSYFQSFVGDTKAALTMTGYKGMGNGSLKEQVNQDRSFVVKDCRYKCQLLLGVLDGHGFKGEIVANYSMLQIIEILAETLPPLLLANDESLLVEEEEKTKVTKALIKAFLDVNSALPSAGDGGSTASIVLQRNKKVYIANVGDSRSFIATYLNNEVNIIYITREDKCHLPGERKRIEAAGGEVTMIHEEGEMEDSRVYYGEGTTETKKSMAMSRSIGDWDAKPFGIIAEPVVDVVYLDAFCQQEQISGLHHHDTFEEQQSKVFVVSASDGLFNFVTPHKIASRVAECLFHNNHHQQITAKGTDHPLLAAEDLIVMAAQGWAEKYNGGRDDITIAFSTLDL